MSGTPARIQVCLPMVEAGSATFLIGNPVVVLDRTGPVDVFCMRAAGEEIACSLILGVPWANLIDRIIPRPMLWIPLMSIGDPWSGAGV